jgi:hypothetical protein
VGKKLIILAIVAAIGVCVWAENIPQSTTRKLTFFVGDGNGLPMTGKTIVPFVSKNGGAFAQAAGTCSEIGKGYYTLNGTASDADTQGSLIMEANYPGAMTAQNVYWVGPVRDGNFSDIGSLLSLTARETSVKGGEANTIAVGLTRGTSNLTAVQVWGESNRSLTARDLFTLVTTPPTASTISAAVWGESNRSLTQLASMAPGGVYSAGSLANAPSGTGADPNTIAARVWGDSNRSLTQTISAVVTSGGYDANFYRRYYDSNYYSRYYDANFYIGATTTYTLDGNVVLDGNGILGVTVSVYADTYRAQVKWVGLTSSAGYWVTSLPRGVYYVWFAKSGYSFGTVPVVRTIP